MAPHQRTRALLLVAAIVAVLATLATGTPVALGRTITVSSLADDGPGTLRQAIADSSDGDRVEFAVRGVIHLQSSLLVTRSLSILGPAYPADAAPQIVLSGDDRVSVLRIGTTSITTLTNLTVTSGRSEGSSAYGGGITNQGRLTLERSRVQDSRTSGNGGGVHNTGHLTATGSVIAANTARSGGGIFNSGTATTYLSGSRIADNTAELERNGTGGGLSGWSPRIHIVDSAIVGNQASAGGGLYLSGYQAYVGGAIESSSIVQNRANRGGGVYFVSGGIATVANSTIADNTAEVGGGVLTDARLTMVNCTLAGNSADAGQGGGFMGQTGRRHGVYVPPVLINTIISDNQGGNCGEPASDGGHNLQHPGLDCGPAIASRDPHLGVLDADHPSPALMPEPWSPAIDAADQMACSIAPVLGVDQRGMARPAGGGGADSACDVGAVEVASDGTPTPGYVPAATPSPPPADLAPDPHMYLSLKRPFTCYWPDMTWGTYLTVYNYGGDDAGPFAVELDGLRRRLEGMAASGSESVFFEAGPGGRQLWAIADVLDEVVEEYEQNNTVAGAVAVPTLPIQCTATPGPSPTATATPVVSGDVSLEVVADPTSCRLVELTGSFAATSLLSSVAMMRTSLDPYENCHGAQERVSVANWRPLSTTVPFAIEGGPVNYRAALGVQYRDEAGHVSPVYCSAAYGECPRTATPTATPSRTPSATSTEATRTPTVMPSRTASVTPTEATRTPTAGATQTSSPTATVDGHDYEVWLPSLGR